MADGTSCDCEVGLPVELSRDNILVQRTNGFLAAWAALPESPTSLLQQVVIRQPSWRHSSSLHASASSKTIPKKAKAGRAITMMIPGRQGALVGNFRLRRRQRLAKSAATTPPRDKNEAPKADRQNHHGVTGDGRTPRGTTYTPRLSRMFTMMFKWRKKETPARRTHDHFIDIAYGRKKVSNGQIN